MKTEDPSKSSLKLENFIFSVEAPWWLFLKGFKGLKDTPQTIFACMKALRSLPYDDLREVAFNSLQRNTYCFLTENLIYATINCKEGGMQDPLSPHEKLYEIGSSNSPINWEADSWEALIDLSSLDEYSMIVDMYIESPAMVHISSRDVNKYARNGKKIELMRLP